MRRVDDPHDGAGAQHGTGHRGRGVERRLGQADDARGDRRHPLRRRAARRLSEARRRDQRRPQRAHGRAPRRHEERPAVHRRVLREQARAVRHVQGPVRVHARRQRLDRLPPPPVRRLRPDRAPAQPAPDLLPEAQPRAGRTAGARGAARSRATRGSPTTSRTSCGRASRAVFATIHVVGSNNDLEPWFVDTRVTPVAPETPQHKALRTAEFDRRQAANLAWIDRTFAVARRERARGVVIAMQANLWLKRLDAGADVSGFDAIVRRIATRARRFRGEVLRAAGRHAQVPRRPAAERRAAPRTASRRRRRTSGASWSRARPRRSGCACASTRARRSCSRGRAGRSEGQQSKAMLKPTEPPPV